MTASTRKLLFHALAVLGLAIPWWFNVAFLQAGGSFAPGPFLAAVSANPLVAGITWDVYLAATAFSLWLLADAPTAGVKRPWLYVALVFGVGLAFALPLYLARRQPPDHASAGCRSNSTSRRVAADK